MAAKDEDKLDEEQEVGEITLECNRKLSFLNPIESIKY